VNGIVDPGVGSNFGKNCDCQFDCGGRGGSRSSGLQKELENKMTRAVTMRRAKINRW